MGAAWTLPHLWKQDEPDCLKPIKYDPHFGFEAPRKERVMIATKQELDSADIEPKKRDFCAHLRIHYRGCMRENLPFVTKCKGLYREMHNCYLDERLFDMKEFEREKRLNARERRIRQNSL